MTELFTIPPCESPRLKWLAKVKADYRIFTHYSPDDEWMAFSMTEAIKLLEDYDLNDEEKNEPMVLFGRYCRLLDESGNLVDRQSTELDAIIELCRIYGWRLWNETGV